MASCYRSNDLLGAHTVCQQQQHQFQQHQQQQHHHLQQQSSSHSLNVPQQSPQKDYSIPLFVDCSVEYELPKQAKPPVGVRVEPLLMIHPCHFRNMEIQTRSPFVNNMPNFKRNSIKPNPESNKTTTATLPVTFHQQQQVSGTSKLLETTANQVQHHQKSQQQQNTNHVQQHTTTNHMSNQTQCVVPATGGFAQQQQHYQQQQEPQHQQQRLQKPHKTIQTSKDYALQSAYCDFSNRLNSHNQMLQLQSQVNQKQQQQHNTSYVCNTPSWSNNYMTLTGSGQAAEPTPRKTNMLPTENYIIKQSNTQCYSQASNSSATLKSQGQLMYQPTAGVGKKDAMLSDGCDMYKNTLTNNSNNNNNNSTTQCNRNYNNMPNNNSSSKQQYADTSLWEPTDNNNNNLMAAIPQNFQIPGDINMSSQALIKNYQINRNNIINSAKYRQYLKSHRIHPYMMTGSCINNGFPQMTSVFPHHQMQQVPCYNV